MFLLISFEYVETFELLSHRARSAPKGGFSRGCDLGF